MLTCTWMTQLSGKYKRLELKLRKLRVELATYSPGSVEHSMRTSACWGIICSWNFSEGGSWASDWITSPRLVWKITWSHRHVDMLYIQLIIVLSHERQVVSIYRQLHCLFPQKTSMLCVIKLTRGALWKAIQFDSYLLSLWITFKIVQTRGSALEIFYRP